MIDGDRSDFFQINKCQMISYVWSIQRIFQGLCWIILKAEQSNTCKKVTICLSFKCRMF